jgi:circadian clock protein KaiC
LQHAVSTARISTGVARLDRMLGGGGFYRGSSILLSGTAGTGKTTLAAHVIDAACARGARALYFAFEESPNQIQRNLRSVGLQLARHVRAGTLRFQAGRPTARGLEAHLLEMSKAVQSFAPAVVVVDPITSFISGGNILAVKSLLVRLIDHLKGLGVTAVFTSLTHGGDNMDATSTEVSSLVDTWIVLRDIEANGERNRGLYVIKSRGMAHSNQVREFQLTRRGIELHDVYVGPEGILTGSARLTQEAREASARLEREQEMERQRRSFATKKASLDGQIATLRATLAVEKFETERALRQLQAHERQLAANRVALGRHRHAD